MKSSVLAFTLFMIAAAPFAHSQTMNKTEACLSAINEVAKQAYIEGASSARLSQAQYYDERVSSKSDLETAIDQKKTATQAALATCLGNN